MLTSGNTVNGGELSDTEGGQENTNGTLLHTGVTVGSVRRVELVAARFVRTDCGRKRVDYAYQLPAHWILGCAST